MEPVRLETTRLVLRELRTEDYDAVRAYVEDPEVTRYLKFPTEPEDTRAWLERMRSLDPKREVQLAIDLDGDLVGSIGVGLTDHATAEMGWALRSDVWGRGIATEAACRIQRFAFEDLRARRVIARADIRNTRSTRVMEKLFMRREGQFAQDEPATEGGFRSSFLYAILAGEFAALDGFPSAVRARCGMDVHISRPKDLKEIHDLQRTVGQAMLAQHGMDHWAEPYDLDEMQADARRRETFAIRDASGDAIASFTIGLTPMWLSEDTLPWTPAHQPLWLHRLMVAPPLQSSGLGSAIMALAEDLGRARGCDVVRLETRADFDAVQRFYARNGYVEVSRHEGKHAPWNALEKHLR
jgi:[ribosomal protein S5]-alanine N-acetyltransferase